MLIKRVYNNNVAMVVDDHDEECIAIGRGMAFGLHPGDTVDASKVERVFHPESPATLDRIERLVRTIPVEYFTIAEDIVNMLRRESNLEVGDALLIALTDHISLSLEREREGVPCDNPLLMDIKRFYKREFELAGRAAQIIEEHTGIRISEAERGFITLHIVNASMGQRADTLVLSISLIQDVLDIVAQEFSLTYDESSIQYERFLRHLQFFAIRVLDESAEQSEDTFLYLLGKDQYPEALACTEKIGEHVRQTFSRSVTDAEKGYLVYHIMNLVNASEKEGSSQ